MSITVTFFPNQYATKKSEAELTLEELEARILKAKAATKDKLPWLKLAVFGNKATPKSEDGKGGGSLRHDANLKHLTGIELDYDGPPRDKDGNPKSDWISMEEVVETLERLQIKCLVYTSPSYRRSEPKWRILAPTSKPINKSWHTKLVARLNGSLGVILHKPESFTLSQSYYYGRSEQNFRDHADAEHRVVVLEGTCLDEHEELAKYEEIGKPKGREQAKPGSDDNSNPFTDLGSEEPEKRKTKMKGFEAILAEIGDGEGGKGFNDPLTRAVSNYIGLYNGHPFDHEVLKNLLREAIDKAPKNPGRDSDVRRYKSDKYLNDIIASATRKFIENRPICVEDFVAYSPDHRYLFIPTRDLWPSSSIDGRLPPVPRVDRMGRPVMNVKKGTQRTIPASKWLDQHRSVEQMTWAPGEQMLIKNRVVDSGGWVAKKNAMVFNTYRAPVSVPGKPEQATLWTQHLRVLYPENADHIIKWFAQRVQHPGVKLNHALLLGGNQGVGKDSILEPVRYAVGAWNFQDIQPNTIFEKFNGFTKSVILRINEARDLGDAEGNRSKYSFYEHLKTLTTAPPESIRLNEKNIREYYIPNVCGVILTTNHQTDSLFIDPDDRRFYVAWSDLKKEHFSEEYWRDYWNWLLNNNGMADVAAYLREYDISDFNPKMAPEQTEAFHTLVSASRSTEDDEFADIIEQLGNPDAISLDQIQEAADGEILDLFEQKNRKQIPHRMKACGYTVVLNPAMMGDLGRWKIGGKRKTLYAKNVLSMADRLAACRTLAAILEGAKNSTVHPFRRG